jgi:hypothetical protein
MQQEPEALTDEHATRFLSSRNPVLRGGLEDRLAMNTLDDDTVLERRPGTPCIVSEHDGRLRVLLGDRELRIPLHLATPMRWIRDSATFRPADLANWLDPESRLVLSRRLVREGLLRVAG